MSNDKGFDEDFDNLLGGENGKEKTKPSTQSSPMSEVEILKKKLEEAKAELEAAKATLPDPTKQSGLSEKDVQALVEKLVAQRLQSSPPTAYRTDTTYEEPPIEDHDPVGVTFYAFRYMHIIAHDKRQGRITYPPKWGTVGDAGLVIFEPEWSTPVRSGRQEDVIIVSSFRSHSKALTEWLRNHTDFNSLIFERLPSVQNSSTLKHAQALAANMAWAKSLAPGAVAQQCAAEGIKVSSTDVDSMRAELAQRLTDKRFTRLPDGRIVETESHSFQTARMGSMNAESLLAKEARENNYANPNATIAGDRVEVAD